MSNYSGLKQDINNNIYENQTQQITGTVLNAILNEMTASLGAGYQFAGVATLGMNPGDPDQRVFYLAGEGIYTSFGGLQVPAGKLGVLKWDNRWTLQTIDGLGGGGANLTGYVSVASTDDLPDEGQPTLGYLCGTNLYLYVGEGGDTKEGKYQDCGSFRGPQGDSVQDVEQTQTSLENGGVNKIKFTLSNGISCEFQVRNGTTSSGLFPTVAALQAAYPNPVVGQYAFVGAGFPADIYVCTTAGTWTDSGEDYDGDNVDLTDYATKAEVNQLEAKVDDLSTGKYYGYFAQEEDLPEADVDGFAYVGEGPTYTIYNLRNGVWTSSDITVNQSPIGNDEDIDQNEDGKLQFANRTYNSLQPNGMGYKILRKDKTFASQVTDTNTIYEIRYNFSLENASVTIPSGCVLKFTGGRIEGGTLVGNNTKIDAPMEKIFATDVAFGGLWSIEGVFPEWFGAVGDNFTDDTLSIKSAIMCSCNTGSTLYLKNEYVFTEKIVVENTINIKCDGALHYGGNETTGYAITFGASNAYFGNANIELKLYNKNPNLYGINGICLKNSNHGRYTIVVGYFADGLTLLGDRKDCDYNIIHPLYIVSNRRNIVLTTTETGYVNQNTFIGGSCRVDSNIAPLIHENDTFFSLYICNTPNTYINNNNTFVGVSFECINEISYVFVEGNNTLFLNCRFENVTYRDSPNNIVGYVIGGFGFNQSVEEVHGTSYIGYAESSIRSTSAISLVTSAQGKLEYKNQNSVELFSVSGAGVGRLQDELSIRGGLTIRTSHGYHPKISASDAVPSTSGVWDSSIHLLGADGGTFTGKRLLVKDGGRWVNGLYSYSATSRPTDVSAGYMMFDSTLGKPIWHKGNNVWVDATGATV